MLPQVCDFVEKTSPPRRKSVFGKLKSWFAHEDGSATIESVLWMPFFVALFTLIVDGTLIFNNHSNVLRVVHDANRAFSVGRLESGAETEAFIKKNAYHISRNIDVSTVVVDGVIATRVEIPAADMDMTGLFTGIAAATLTINAQHYLEI